MSKKDLFQENPSFELDQKILDQAEARLSGRQPERRKFLNWAWNGGVALASLWVAFSWIKLKRPDPFEDVNSASMDLFLDEHFVMTHDPEFDFEKDMDMVDDLELLDEWQEEEV